MTVCMNASMCEQSITFPVVRIRVQPLQHIERLCREQKVAHLYHAMHMGERIVNNHF